MNNLNRFQAFSDSEHEQSDDEVSQKKTVDNRSRAEKRKGKSKPEEKTTQETQSNNNNNDGKRTKSAREGPKQKGVPAEPHPQDKHSGSGLRTHDRKGGAGKGNWGTFKDELKQDLTNQEGETQEQQEEEQAQEQQVTLSEYFASLGVSKSAQQQQAQQKGNNDYTSFIKEGCQIIEKVDQVDDKNLTKKNKQFNDRYIGMQSTDLLGFRTGLKTVQQRQPRQPKEEAPRQEGEQTTTNQEPAQEGVAKTEQKEEGERKPYRNNNNNNRSGKGNYKGEKRGGNRGPQKSSVKVNLEDDSLFPKLG